MAPVREKKGAKPTVHPKDNCTRSLELDTVSIKG
jgi:hypothetical protein